MSRHERSKGDDGLRTNYWYLLRSDGHEDLAVIGREIKGSGGHYNYNSVRNTGSRLVTCQTMPQDASQLCLFQQEQ
jgi:hypothetical protein